jgi:hypothetical protein
LQKSAKKVFCVALLAVILTVGAIIAFADGTIVRVGSADNGSAIFAVCGSSAGSFRVIYDAANKRYIFEELQPGDCD